MTRGESFSFPNLVSHWDYGAGATIGSPVTIRFTGLFGHATGFIASDAGVQILKGVVTGFDEFGIPIVEFTDLVVEHGNRGDDVVTAICTALGG